MHDFFPFNVGDRITSPHLTTGGRVRITAIGLTVFTGLVFGCEDLCTDGTEQWFSLTLEDADWSLA